MSRDHWLNGLKTRLIAGSRQTSRRGGRLRRTRRFAPAEVLEDRVLLVAPTAFNDSYTVNRDVYTVAASGVLANDYDPDFNVPLSAVLVAGPSNGSLTLNANGSFTYTPNANYVGSDSFTYQAKDTTNALSNTATVSLTVTKPYSARLNSDDLPEAGAQSFGAVAASVFTGEVSAAHEIAPGHALVYSSFTATPKPVIAAEADYATASTNPSSTTVTLTYDGTAGTPVWYGSAMSGQRVRFALQADATALATGRYAWSMEVKANYSGGGTATRTYGGYDHVVNRSGSEFSKGWTLAELDRLHVQSGGVLYVSGTGVASWFASNGSGGYTSPPGSLNASTLVLNGGGTYTLTDKHGNAENFSSAGLLTSRVDANGNTVAYAYTDADSDGTSDEISTITDPFGRTTTFGYASGKVTSVTDVAGRVTAIAYDGSGRLSTVTRPDPDGAGSLTAPVTTYAYATGTSRLTSVTDPLSHTTTVNYDFAGRVSQVVYHDSTDRDVANWQSRGLVNLAGGTGTSGSPATLYMPTYVTGSNYDELNRQTKTTYDRFGNLLSFADPLNNLTTYTRDSNGRVTQVTQPDPDGGGALAAPVTGFAYDAKGNLLTLTNPGGSTKTYTYHSTHNRVLTETNELSKTTTYTYDSDGNVLTVTDPLSHVTTSTYNSRGQVLTVTRPDPDGAGSLTAPVTSYAYDSYGRLTTVTNPDSSTKTYTYTTSDRVATATDELSRVTTYAYDALDRLTSVTLPDPDGAGSLTSPVTSYAYDAAGRLTSTTDPAGKATTYGYDVRDRLTSTTLPDPDGAGSLAAPVYGRSYNAAGQLSTETDPLGKVTTYGYDGAGRLYTVTKPDPDGAGSLTSPVTYYGYDNLSRVTTVTDPLGYVTTTEYDARGWVTKVTRPDPDGWGSLAAPVTQYAYDNAGRLTSETNPLGKVTTYAHDDANRLTSVTYPDPDGAGSLTSPVVSYGYDNLDRLTSQTDPLSKVTTYAYNARGRLTTVTLPDPDGAGSLTSPVTTTAYDVAGRVTSVTDPLGNVTSYAYDNLGRLTSTTLPDPDGAGSLTSPVYQTAYDSRGNVTSTTYPLGKVTTYAYDFLSRLTSKTDPDPDGAGSLTAPVTTYTYDAACRMTGLNDPVGNDTTWTYDALGRVTAETNELAETRTFAYDANSNLTSKTDRNGRVTEYVYDRLNRLTTERWKTGGTTVNTITSVYDAASQLTSITDSYSTYAYTYDALGRVLTVNNDGTAPNLDVLLTNVYDAAGRRTSMAASVNATADLKNEWQYDGLGRTTRVTQQGQTGGNAVAAKRVDLGYDAAGRFSTISRYEDLAGTLLAAATVYTFDFAGRLTALDHTKGATNLANYTWTYDANGRLTATTSVDGSTSYTYDDGGQLTGADHSYQTDETYGYDANGNRTNTGYTVGTNNRITTDGVYDYAYDDEGNRTRKTTIATGAYVDYTWDHRNRLTAVTYKTSGGTKTKEVTYRYDVFGRRVAKDVDDDGNGTVDRGEWYAYDGLDIVLRSDRNGNVTNRYLHGPEVDQVFADESTTDGLLWALADQQGTVRDWADYTSGTDTTAVADHVKYDSFGRITVQSSGTHKPLFAFTGREWDADAGLYYYRARWYDPAAGEFLSEDPIGFTARDPNLGRYVGNAPTNMRDPSGLFQEPASNGLPPLPSPPPLVDVTITGKTLVFPNWEKVEDTRIHQAMLAAMEVSDGFKVLGRFEFDVRETRPESVSLGAEAEVSTARVYAGAEWEPLREALNLDGTIKIGPKRPFDWLPPFGAEYTLQYDTTTGAAFDHHVFVPISVVKPWNPDQEWFRTGPTATFGNDPLTPGWGFELR